ncbi:MAG TPA: cytochrome P450 [Polyangiaceae bacterium]|nr:cytochrome P450 [Polyangiaceae bacterium]
MTGPEFAHSKELSGFSGLLHFAESPLGALEEARRLHGPLVYYRQPGSKVLLILDPPVIETLLVGEASKLVKDEFTRHLSHIVGQGLLTSEGELWKRQRKLLAPSFQPRQIAGFAEVMVERTLAMLAQFEEGQERDVHAEMMHLTLDVVVRTLFGSEIVRANEVEHSLESIMADYRSLMMSWRAAFPPWFPFPARVRFKSKRKALRAIINELIVERRKAPPGSDLLSTLIAARDDEGRGMSDEQLLDEAMTVFLAGHETTALSLAFTLFLLDQNQGVQAELSAELDRVLAGAAPSYEDAQRLPYCTAVVREAMRLYPPAWAMGREATQDFSLAGFPVARGTQLITAPWIVHRDERFFRDPAAFRPERWLNGETNTLPRFAYFPFGGGPRVCIGNHFALLEAVLVLSTIVSRVRLERSEVTELTLSPSVTLRPKGALPMRVTRRSVRQAA